MSTPTPPHLHTPTLDRDYLLRLHESLVNIPSVFPQEEQIMLFVEEELRNLGFRPERLPVEEGRFNLLTRLGSGSPVFCLNAHSDTIPPSGESVPQARIEDGRMYGLGSVDDKSCVAAMITAFRAIAESGIALNGALDLLISVDEEGDANGVRTAVRNGYKCDMAVVGEATSMEIVRSHCGLIFLDIVTHGKATHGSIPMEGINAVDRMYELVQGLRALVAGYPAHPTVGPASLNLGIIRAGDRPNRVPDRCDASIDIRIVAPMKADETLARIKAYFAEWPDAEYEITKKGEPLDTHEDSPVICAVFKACGSIGFKPPVVGWRGWTEAESFQTGLGVDAIVFGPGELKRAHSANEYVELDEVHKAALVYARTALLVLGGCCP